MRVFLGGTVNDSTWRDYVMPKLEIEYFNPVVPDWNEDAMSRELYERRHCDYCLYVLTPKMDGFYALAEVIDDSFKRPDRTVFCFLSEDGAREFNSQEVKSLNLFGKKVTQNGGIWLHSLDDVVAFLNSSRHASEARAAKAKDEVHDIFISYGRKHSKAFATRLYNSLQEKGYSVWFDQNDIPLEIGSLEKVNDGIRRAHNFIFIISPHAVRSEYCRREIEYALKLNKRLIPIVHIEPKEDWGLMHPAIEKMSWIYFQDHINKFENSFGVLLKLLELDSDYVENHTRFLIQALEWEKHHRVMEYLLYGQARNSADAWLKIKFEGKEPPCLPTKLHEDFIIESKKLEASTRLAFWLNRRFAFVTEHKLFNPAINLLSLANPVSMLPQLFALWVAAEAHGVSLGMWYLFVAIQGAFTLNAIKNKDIGVFISMALSMVVSACIIFLATIKS